MAHRRMMILLALLVAVGLSGANAQGSPYMVYVPIVIKAAGALETLVLQRSDLPTSYTRTARFVENAEEALTYPNSNAALTAFRQQGRETSYYVIFTSQAFAASGALSVSDKVARYASAQGARAGQDFARTASLTQGYEQFDATALGQNALGFQRTSQGEGATDTRVQYLFSIQQDVYLALVYVVGQAQALDRDEAFTFAQKAAARLPSSR